MKEVERERNKQFAIDHTALMLKQYEKRIKNSFSRTIMYGVDAVVPLFVGYPDDLPKVEISFTPEDIVSAIFNHANGNTAILDFASYKEPCGGFMKGDMGQEECICMASNLYNIVVKFDDTFYDWNKRHLEHGLYMNRALYVPDVVFGLEGHMPTRCNVITCAAPNIAGASSASMARHFKVKPVDNRRALQSRIKFVKMIAEENKIETLIAGAYGCGTFGQNPKQVAEFFEDVFERTTVKRLIFAVPKDDERNHNAFAERFS